MGQRWTLFLGVIVIAVAAVVGACTADDAPVSADESELRTCGQCSQPLSPFAKKSLGLLETRFCDETRSGDRHENPFATSAEQKERDTIFTLLAFAVTAKHWDLRRGQQIGAVIVRGDRVLKAGFNANFVEESPVEHAEVRAIRELFADAKRAGASGSPSSMLEDATIYGTLEPCPMCAGTITMSRIKRVVFGMKDVRFGDALHFLHAFPYHADFEIHEDTRTSRALAEEVRRNPDESISVILDRMKYAFDWAIDDLMGFDASSANQNALRNAKAALERLP
jgi:tRNA(adenine34) deaminase